MRVLHATRGTVDAVLAGCPILPVEGLVCPNPACRGGYQIDESPFGEPVGWCPVCERGVVPPVLSGRIAIAVDGAIAATATADEVLQVFDAWDAALGFPHRAIVVGTGGPDEPIVLVDADADASTWPVVADYSEHAAALDLRPGGWVVAVSDVAPTTERCPNPACEHGSVKAITEFDQVNPDMTAWGQSLMACPVCDCEESCPPVPVSAAPAGTVTTWEAT